MGFVPIHPAASERDRLVPRKSLERSHRMQGTVRAPSAPLARPTAPRRSLGQHEGARPHRTSDPPRRSRAHHRARTLPSAVHDPAASSQGRPTASSEQHGAPDSHSEPPAAEYPVRTRESRRWSAACCARSSMTLFRSAQDPRPRPWWAREAGVIPTGGRYRSHRRCSAASWRGEALPRPPRLRRGHASCPTVRTGIGNRTAETIGVGRPTLRAGGSGTA